MQGIESVPLSAKWEGCLHYGDTSAGIPEQREMNCNKATSTAERKEAGDEGGRLSLLSTLRHAHCP